MYYSTISLLSKIKILHKIIYKAYKMIFKIKGGMEHPAITAILHFIAIIVEQHFTALFVFT